MVSGIDLGSPGSRIASGRTTTRGGEAGAGADADADVGVGVDADADADADATGVPGAARAADDATAAAATPVIQAKLLAMCIESP
jgi:hypothetical protein